MMLFQPHSQNLFLKGIRGKNVVPQEAKIKQVCMFPMNKVEVIVIVKENIFRGIREGWSSAVEHSHVLDVRAQIR